MDHSVIRIIQRALSIQAVALAHTTLTVPDDDAVLVLPGVELADTHQTAIKRI